MIDFLGYITLRALSLIFCCIPLRIGLWIGRRCGDLVYFLNSRRRAIAYANLKSAFPEKPAHEIKGILRSHFENLGMSIVELLKLPVLGRRYIDRHIAIKNPERIKEALDKGKGVIFLSAHFGNWEIASLVVNAKGYRMSVFVREQKHKRLNALLNRYREMTGSRVITKGFSVRNIIRTLNNNGIVAMLADQDAGANGVFVDFLGRPASMAQGPVSFGLKTGAVILPTFMRRIGYNNHVLEMGEPLELVNTGEKEKDMKLNLEKITGVFESFLKKFPEEWLWSHKRWKSTPQRTVLVLSDKKPGHLNQAMAVAEMAQEALRSRLKARGIEEKPVVRIRAAELRFRNGLTRLFLDIASLFAGTRCQGCLRCLRFCLKKESFDEVTNNYADLIISCGASTTGAGIFLRYENNAKGISIMRPGLGRNKKFDLVILPRHDAPMRLSRNVLVTEAAPNRIISSDTIQGKGLGLLIGGDAKNFRLTKETVEKVLNGILKIAGEMDRDVFISTSRRTPRDIEEFLKEALKDNTRCKLLVIVNEKNIGGAVRKIFDMSEVVTISPESISMISEAASSGKYTIVFNGESSKYAKAVRNLKLQGYIDIAEPERIYDLIKKVLRDAPKPKKLDDRRKIIQHLQGIL
jgi:KDO2-lipid IV(A) lauroyltransferase